MNKNCRFKNELFILLRENKGFTQNQLADDIGLSAHTVSNLERNQKIPRLETLLKIAIYFNTSLCEFIDGIDGCISEDEITLIETLRKHFTPLEVKKVNWEIQYDIENGHGMNIYKKICLEMTAEQRLQLCKFLETFESKK